jgi:hypothetical protein
MTPATSFATETQTFLLESKDTPKKPLRRMLDLARVLKQYNDSVSLHIANCDKQAQESGVPNHRSGDNFPDDIDTQLEYVIVYLFMCTKRTEQPKAINGNTTMSYNNVKGIGTNLWQIISFNRRSDAPPLGNNVYFSHMSNIVQKMSNDGIVTHEQKAKCWLTRDDCYYMIQDDMVHACLTDRNMIEVLGDHLIWCFGLLTRVRTMSLMRTQHLVGGDPEAKSLKDIGVSPLCWGDITITRDTESKNDSEINRFIVLLRFRMLKGHVEGPC